MPVDHARELLSLRDGSTDGELYFRKQILRLLGAAPEPGLTGLGMVHRVRRVEGALTVPDRAGELTGLVMFAVGDDGKGNLSDIRSKSAQPSARSALRQWSKTPQPVGGSGSKSSSEDLTHPALAARGADFVVVVTTGEPSDAMLELAEAKSDLFYLGPALRRRIWVMGVPEIVERAEEFLVVRGAVPARKGLRGWFSRVVAIVKDDDDAPVSPLQVELGSDREELERLEKQEIPAE